MYEKEIWFDNVLLRLYNSTMFTKALVFVVLTIVLLSLVWVLFKNPFGRPTVEVDVSRASVIKEIQKLGSLETASFTIEKIVEAGQQGNVFQDLLYGDRILLIASGKVIAGVDLYAVSDSDVNTKADQISINLPSPRILSSTLDNSKTRVYDRTQGYLSRGNKDLESEARRAAEASITKAACEGGILEEARTNAIERIKQLFKFSGFSSVTVTIPVGSC